MTMVIVGSKDANLCLTPESAAGPPHSLVAELRVGDLRATQTVVEGDSGFAALAAFAAQIAADWRGWDGTRTWESVEGDLRIEARHDGHVDLRVVLRDGPTWTWTATALLRLEPGEQLSAIAADLHALAAGR